MSCQYVLINGPGLCLALGSRVRVVAFMGPEYYGLHGRGLTLGSRVKTVAFMGPKIMGLDCNFWA